MAKHILEDLLITDSLLPESESMTFEQMPLDFSGPVSVRGEDRRAVPQPILIRGCFVI